VKDYRVIVRGGLKVVINTTDVIAAANQACVNLSINSDEIVEVSEIFHYFKSSVAQEDKTPGMST